MTHDEAIKTLKNGGSLVQLAEAIGVVASDPQSSLEEIMLGLSHPGFVQEQAALALYRRTGQVLPDDRARMITSQDEWVERIPEFDGASAELRQRFDSLPEPSRTILLRLLEGRTLPEISNEFGLTRQAVRGGLNQVVRALQAFVEK